MLMIRRFVFFQNFYKEYIKSIKSPSIHYHFHENASQIYIPVCMTKYGSYPYDLMWPLLSMRESVVEGNMYADRKNLHAVVLEL